MPQNWLLRQNYGDKDTGPSKPGETCGETTDGMFDRLLGPCLKTPGHPEEDWHRDVRGTEWRNHARDLPQFTRDDLKVLRLCIAAVLSQHFLVHFEDQAPDCCAEAVLDVFTPKDGSL